MSVKKAAAVALIVVTFPVAILFWIGCGVAWAIDQVRSG